MQMKEQGYILHAATYLMVIDQQTEAIDLLLKHEFFREALANARIHLPATDPMIKTIINKWLEQLEKTGNFAAAALMWVLFSTTCLKYLFNPNSDLWLQLCVGQWDDAGLYLFT